MCYLSKEHVDKYRKLFNFQNKDEVNARPRGRYAERKKDGLLMAISGEFDIE